jgi:hypothetical protein
VDLGWNPCLTCLRLSCGAFSRLEPYGSPGTVTGPVALSLGDHSQLLQQINNCQICCKGVYAARAGSMP